MDQLEALLPTVGVPGMLVIALLAVFRAVYTGALVPRSTYEDVLHDRDQWRAAHEVSELARQEQKVQVNELLEQARTTTAFIRALGRVELVVEEDQDATP